MENGIALKCSCQKLVAAGWKVSCQSCGRNELGITLRRVAELEAGDRVLIYGDVEAVVESAEDATKAGDTRRWVALRYRLDIGLAGTYVCPAVIELPVRPAHTCGFCPACMDDAIADDEAASAAVSHPAGRMDVAS